MNYVGDGRCMMRMDIKRVRFELVYHQKQTWGPKFDLLIGSSTYMNMLVSRSHYYFCNVHWLQNGRKHTGILRKLGW